MGRKSLEQQLLEADLLDELQLRAARSEQQRWGNSLIQTLHQMHLVDEIALVEILARQYGLETVDLYQRAPIPTLIERLGEAFCRERKCVGHHVLWQAATLHHAG
jgi:hypothetical protein